MSRWLSFRRAFLLSTALGSAICACGGGRDAETGDGDGGGVTPGSAYEGGEPSEAATSAPDAPVLLPGVDAGAGDSFCSKLSPSPTFCSDFDEGPASLAPWMIFAMNVYGGAPDAGSVSLDTTTSVSSPASLEEITYPVVLDAGEVNSALVLKDLGVSGSEATLAADVLLPPDDPTVLAAVELAFVHPDGTEDPLDLVLGGEVALGAGVFQSIPVGDAGGVTSVKSFSLGSGVPSGGWHRVTLDVVVGPPATVSVTVDSNVVLDAGVLDPRFTNGDVQALLNLQASYPASTESLHLDNVVVNVTP
jgi:hypothetical protein